MNPDHLPFTSDDADSGDEAQERLREAFTRVA